jgi:hypothetical protein
VPVCFSASQANSRVPNFNFDIEDGFFFIICKIHNCKVLTINIPCKIPNGKVLAHLGSKEFPGAFTDLSVWVGFCTSSPQQGVKCQLRYRGERGSINIPCKIPKVKDIGGGPYTYFL